MFRKIYSLLWSTNVALVLLVLVFLACVAGASMPKSISKEVVYSSVWFNLLLVLLIVNIVFCITKRTRFLQLSQAGTTIFHLGLVALFFGVVYDHLFFFEGTIRLTEGETLRCDERTSYDGINSGRFFNMRKLRELGDLYFHKLHVSYREGGKERGVASEIVVGTDVRMGEHRVVYVPHPVRYKGFEFYRVNADGYSPLFVLRDEAGRIYYGAYTALQSIKQKDGTYMYRSGSAAVPERFDFPQAPDLPAIFKLQTAYYPDPKEIRSGEVTFTVWKNDQRTRGPSEELFSGKAGIGERVKVGRYFLSMDEVRYWTKINISYQPGLPFIFGSFWLTLGGLILNFILKIQMRRVQESTAA